MKNHDNLEKTKSAWNKPVLTVLVRNNPEERVLAGCKMGPGMGGGGPDSNYDACGIRAAQGCPGPCDQTGMS